MIRGWKSSARTGDVYLKNYLFERLGEPIPRTGNSDAMFRALMRRSHLLLFGKEPSPEMEEAAFSEAPPPPPGSDQDPAPPSRGERRSEREVKPVCPDAGLVEANQRLARLRAGIDHRIGVLLRWCR